MQGGSSFGSIGYNGTTTWGNFGGSSYFGSSVGSPFTGTCVSHIKTISADHIYGKYIEGLEADIGTLRAKDAEITNLVATKASIESLNAVNATVNTLNATVANVNKLVAQKANVSDLNALKAKVGNLTVTSGGLSIYDGRYSWFMASNSSIGNYVSWTGG